MSLNLGLSSVFLIAWGYGCGEGYHRGKVPFSLCHINATIKILRLNISFFYLWFSPWFLLCDICPEIVLGPFYIFSIPPSVQPDQHRQETSRRTICWQKFQDHLKLFLYPSDSLRSPRGVLGLDCGKQHSLTCLCCVPSPPIIIMRPSGFFFFLGRFWHFLKGSKLANIAHLNSASCWPRIV